MATAASQFKCEVGPVGRDDNRRGMTGKQGEVKERERTVKKEKKKKGKIKSDTKTLLFIYKRLHLSAGLP